MTKSNAVMTDAELTILSLVAEGPQYGYEIQHTIDDRGLREWLTIGFSSIYYILNKLERQNMVTSEMRADGQTPAHKMYRITDGGRGILQTSISELLRQPRAFGTGFELGLANLTVLKPRQVYKVLSDHHVDLKLRLEAVASSWIRHQAEDSEPIAEHIWALYTHSIALMKAELEWLESFIADWKAKYPAVVQPSSELRNDPIVENGANARVTQYHKRTTPDPAKMIQRLKRSKLSTSEHESTSDKDNNNHSDEDEPESPDSEE